METLLRAAVRADTLPTTDIETIEEVLARRSEDYRTADIRYGFNWPAIAESLTGGRWLNANKLYLVVFRSTRKEGADPAEIARLDAAAHAEAIESGALRHYFADEPNEQGEALSWCLWDSREAALKALSGPNHREAVARAREFYQTFTIEAHDVVVTGVADERQVALHGLMSHTYPPTQV